MVVLTHSIKIRVSTQRLQQVLLNPLNFPKWHPSSKSVRIIEKSPGPLGQAECFEEEFAIAGWRGQARWRIRFSPEHRQIVLLGEGKPGESGSVTYEWEQNGGDTAGELLVRRTLVYSRQGWVLAWLDRWVFRIFVERSQQKAMEQLKRWLER